MSLGVVMIVKDEAASIARCLRSAIAAGVTVATVFDTGSTDRTLDVIRDECAGIELHLHEAPFVDFGHNRSEAFAAAAGTADWLIAMDADFTVEIDPAFEPDPSVAAYMLEMREGSFAWRLPLLLNGRMAWKSVGAVHEYTVLQDGRLGERQPTDLVRITNHGDNRGSTAKSRWHASLLEAELARNPDDPRTLFYLGQTYRGLGRLPEAREFYLRRAELIGWDEERFFAAYRAALLASDWPTRSAELLAAWEMRPQRLEPLYALIKELNERDMHQAAYRLASVPIAPTSDVLLVDRAVWDWGMLFQRSIAAWWVGARGECRDLSSALLSVNLPADVRKAVQRNLGLCAPREFIAVAASEPVNVYPWAGGFDLKAAS